MAFPCHETAPSLNLDLVVCPQRHMWFGGVALSIELSRDLVAKLFDRKALLWICQRAELEPDAEVHTDSTPLEDAVSRYRREPGAEDEGFGDIFWEACWTDSIVDRFYEAASKASGFEATGEHLSQSRLPYRLATDPDNEGQIDRRRFLLYTRLTGRTVPVTQRVSTEGH